AVHLAAFSEPGPALLEKPLSTAPSGQAAPIAAPDKTPRLAAPEASAPRPTGGGQPLTLDDLEAIALSNNPTLAQAAARVGAARADAFQSGLWHNPAVGYLGSEIGNE